MTAIFRRFDGPEIQYFYHSAAVEMQCVFLREIIVPASTQSLDTGVTIQPLDRLIFRACGQVWAGVLLTGANGPEGWPYRESGRRFPLTGGHPYSLLGQLAGRYFEIGLALERVYIGATPERLFLGINNDAPGSGIGTFTCTIEIWRLLQHERLEEGGSY